MIDNNRIVEALRTVPHPLSAKDDIVQARMVQDLRIQDNEVNFTLQLPPLPAASKAELHMACVQAVNAVYPDASVNVHMSQTAPQATGPAPGTMPHVKNIIAVGSGKGGVGKSTVSVNLAIALKQLGARVGLIDADLWGPSMPTMLGLQGQRPKVHDVNGKAKITPLVAYGVPVISVGFIIEPDQAVVLRGPRLGALIRQFIQDVTWPPLDYLIIDLPPGTGDVQLSLVQTVPVTGAVMVTTPQDVAVADAVKAMNMFRLPNINVPILGVVENMSWFTPAELPNNKYYLFGEGGGKKLARDSNSMLLGQVPLIQSVREGGDSGQPIVTQAGHPAAQVFDKIAKNVIRQVAIRHDALDPTRIVPVQS